MSGPKSVHVSVDQGRARARAIARRERARRRELQERAKRLLTRLSRIAEQWQAARREHGDVIAEWPYGDLSRDLSECESDRGRGNDELRLVLDDLAAHVVQAEGDLSRQSAINRVRASLEAVSRSRAADARTPVRSAEEDDERRDESGTRHCAEEVSRLLKTLAAEVPREARTAIEERAVETVRSSPAFRRNALLSQLRLDVQGANEAAAERRRIVAQAGQWREELLGLEGPDVEELDRHLRQVVDGETPAPDLAQRVGDVAARAAEASDRAYALSVITEELETLGYVVERGFETASARQSELLLQSPEIDDDYRVALRAEGPLLHTRVVREARDVDPDGQSPADVDRERTDIEMERIWCHDLAAALATARHRGAFGRVVSRKKAGEVPVHTIPGRTRKSKARRKRKRKRTGGLNSRIGR